MELAFAAHPLWAVRYAVVAANGLAVALGSLFGRHATALFTAGYLIALALCLDWAALNGWPLIEFSEAGVID